MPDIAGLKLIVPTSVAGSGVSVSASGKVTFTAATAVNINGCFTSTYDNYLIVVRAIGSIASENYRGRLRLSGTDASGTNYVFQQLAANGTTVSGSRPAAQNHAEFSVTGATTLRDGLHIYVYGAALAQPTAFRSVTICALNNAAIADLANTHSLSTAYDGITLYPSSGNMTGACTIYGLAN